jgi:hypothetical protein
MQEQRWRPLFCRCFPLLPQKGIAPETGLYTEWPIPHIRNDIKAKRHCQFDKRSVGTTWIAIAGRHCRRALNHPYAPLH